MSLGCFVHTEICFYDNWESGGLYAHVNNPSNHKLDLSLSLCLLHQYVVMLN